ncbi:MAG TPA: FecR domain-containing protein [Polyangiaceae bacterium]|nr:FecR domain-containing protein [Polyangiaceae bacterium]
MDLDRRLSEGPLRVTPLWSAEQTERLPQRLLLARRRRAIVRGVAGVSAALAVAAGFWLWSPKSADLSGAAAVASAVATPSDRDFTLPDGSQVRLLGVGSKVEVLEQTAALVRTALGAGSARFDVRHDPARVFEVESGDVKVRVLGTAFSVALEGGLTRVAVERGAVRVQWTGGQAFLSAGQAGVYPPPAAAAANKAPAEPLSDLAGNVGEEAASWRKLANRGAYNDAYKALGPSASKSVRDEPADLMLAADVARLSRHPGEATRFLARVSDGFPRDKRAPLAAFTLGRVLLEDLGQPGRAADAFRRAHQLAPKGPLAADALAREVDAAQRAGQVDRARQVAARYIELYPEGPQAQRLRKL